MFEQKINTVSIRVNEESFAVVPFDNYKDAVQAAKQALVELSNGERVELLGKRIDAVERALGDKLTNGITTLYVGGRGREKSCIGDAIKALNERVVDPNSNEVKGKIIPANFDFVGALFDAIPRNPSPLEAMGKRIETLEKVVEMLREGVDRPHKRKEPEGKAETLDLRQSAPLPKARHPDLSTGDLITWGYQDDGTIMAITSNADIASEWIKEGKKVFEIQQKPINY